MRQRGHDQNEGIVGRANARKIRLALAIGVSVTLCSLVLILATGSDSRRLFSDVLSIASSGVALALCMQVIKRQKLSAAIPRLYASLGTGIALWFIAECIWGYYELVQRINTPFPSIADAFWLAGYAPYAYFLVGMLRKLIGLTRSITFPGVAISALIIVALAVTLQVIYQKADLKTSDGMFSYLVSSAYPIADMILVVPTIAMFIRLRKGKLMATPWAYFVLAPMLFIVADLGFDYFTSVGGMDDLLWIWEPLYIAGYLAIANSILWYKDFFTVDEKKLLREWQEKNR